VAMRDRRMVIKAALAVPALLWLPRGLAKPTPECGDGPPTPNQTAGPFYMPAAPEKSDFRKDDPSAKLLDLKLRVIDTGCAPLAGAIVEIWHADSRGRYDNDGFRLRGHLRANAEGAVNFRAVTPGAYPGRTRHYHVRVLREGQRLLTTQLYFPGEPGNDGDGLFEKELLLNVSGATARYALVVES
jgi:protocatechuate 3,4-dioxygenase beta subunit